jgi:hypothetical protein
MLIVPMVIIRQTNTSAALTFGCPENVAFLFISFTHKRGSMLDGSEELQPVTIPADRLQQAGFLTGFMD